MIKKILFPVVAVLFLLTSCLTMSQMVLFTEDVFVVNFQFTYNAKELLDFAKQFDENATEAGTQPLSNAEFEQGIAELKTSMNELVGDKCQVTAINEDNEIGFNMIFYIDEEETNPALLTLLPFEENGNVEIPLVFSQSWWNESSTEFDDLAKIPEEFIPFLEEVYFSLLIDQQIASTTDYALIYSNAEEPLQIFPVAQEDYFIFQIPFTFLIESGFNLSNLILVDESKQASNSLGSGPFSYNMGMDLAAVEGASARKPILLEESANYQIFPIKGHSAFDIYYAWIDETYGLNYIKAVSESVDTNKFGAEVKEPFQILINALERKYGAFSFYEEYEEDWVFDAPEYFKKSIEDGALNYGASRTFTEQESAQYNDLVAIYIGISAEEEYPNDLYLWLEYEFANSEIVDSQEDDNL